MQARKKHIEEMSSESACLSPSKMHHLDSEKLPINIALSPIPENYGSTNDISPLISPMAEIEESGLGSLDVRRKRVKSGKADHLKPKETYIEMQVLGPRLRVLEDEGISVDEEGHKSWKRCGNKSGRV